MSRTRKTENNPDYFPLGASSNLPPDTRNWDFEKGLLDLWTPGTRVTVGCSLDTIERSFRAATHPTVSGHIVDRTEHVLSCSLVATSAFTHADVTFQAWGNGTVVSFASSDYLCNLKYPAGDEIHNFISQVVYWALKDWQENSDIEVPKPAPNNQNEAPLVSKPKRGVSQIAAKERADRKAKAIRLKSEGRTIAEIAERLSVSEETVERDLGIRR